MEHAVTTMTQHMAQREVHAEPAPVHEPDAVAHSEPPRASDGPLLQRALQLAALRRSDAPGRAEAQHQLQTQRAQHAQASPVGRALQRRAKNAAPAGPAVHQAAAAGVASGGTALPHLRAIQKSFGRHDVSAVQAYVGGPAKDASAALGAEAYATGDKVAFTAAPSLHLAAHEAAHVIQQRAGVQLSGGVGSAGDAYEKHADAVADLVVSGRSAEALLDTGTGTGGGTGLQKRDAGVSEPVDAGLQPATAAGEPTPCGAELGATLEFRSAGLPTDAEIAQYQAECEARLGQGHTIEIMLDVAEKSATVIFTVVESAALGTKRVARTLWHFVDYNEKALLEIGSESNEVLSFVAMMGGNLLALDAWMAEPTGPIMQMCTSIIGTQLKQQLKTLTPEQRQQIATHVGIVAGKAAKNFAIKKIAKKLVAMPIATAGVSEAIAFAAGEGIGAVSGLASAGSKLAKRGPGAIAVALIYIGFLERVSPARQRLKAQYPAAFSIAAAHNAAFLWHYLEPHLNALLPRITQELFPNQAPRGDHHG